MSDNTDISWADDTRNPASGCSEARLKDGRMDLACLNCYARLMSVRQAAMMAALGRTSIYEGVAERAGGNTATWTGVFRWDPELLRKVFAEMRGGKVTFLGSMTDLWHEQHDPALGVALAQEMRALGARPPERRPAIVTVTKRADRLRAWQREHFPEGLPPWQWPGVTAGSQAAWNERSEELLRLRAQGPKVVSVEPMTTAVELGLAGAIPGAWMPDLGYLTSGYRMVYQEIGWVISGGESGQKARPSHPDWFRALRDECAATAVPYHHKQNGEYIEVPLEEARGGDLWLCPDRGAGKEGGRAPHTQLWRPGDRGAAAGRWSKYRDVVVRRVGKSIAGRQLDGRTHDARPEFR